MSYSYLRLLQQRLVDDGSDDGDGDGYYVRTKEDAKLGPMTERQFNALRSSPDVDKVLSAWRQSGGSFFKVQLRRSIVCDTRHAFSLKAVNHICEMGIIIVCFCCTIGVFFLMIRSPQLKKERAQSGEFAWNLLMFLFVVTVLAGAFTVRTLIGRWRKVSTEVFTSEV
jgi:hypothetical protein